MLPLPGELIAAILSTDHSTLKNCSLICKAWLPWTRYYLFHTIRVDSRNQMSFLNLLQSPLCSFPGHIKRLDISQAHRDYSERYNISVRNVIDGSHPWLNFHPDKDRKSTSKQSFTLRHYHFLHILNLLPSLQYLEVSLSQFQNMTGERNDLPLISTHLRSLVLRCYGGTRKVFLKWFEHNKLYSLQRLYLNGVSSEDVVGIEQILASQSSLEHLHLKLVISFDKKPWHINLASCTSLKSAHFNLSRRGYTRRMASTISTLPTQHITRVGFDVRVEVLLDQAEKEGLARIGTFFASEPLSRLQRLQFRLEYESPFRLRRADAMAAIDEAFRNKCITLEALPYERRDEVRSMTDDCWTREGS